jgi:dTMP kinase
MHLETEALLMFAARREHLAQLIEPALARGAWVISDRFTDASYAYQAGGRGLPLEKFSTLEQWVHPDLQPDLTFLFDLAPDIAARRLAAGRDGADRFEREQTDFFERVRAAYLLRARESAGRIVVLDANRAPEQIQADVLKTLEERFA